MWLNWDVCRHCLCSGSKQTQKRSRRQHLSRFRLLLRFDLLKIRKVGNIHEFRLSFNWNIVSFHVTSNTVSITGTAFPNTWQPGDAFTPLYYIFRTTRRQHQHKHKLCKWRASASWLAQRTSVSRLALGAVVLATSPSHVALCSPFSPIFRSPNQSVLVSRCHSTLSGHQIHLWRRRSELSPESSTRFYSRWHTDDRHEHFQANRRSLSPSSHHHPAAKNMENQVLCRWVALNHLLCTFQTHRLVQNASRGVTSH